MNFVICEIEGNIVIVIRGRQCDQKQGAWRDKKN